MIDRAHPVLLGSASPRRREILTALGLPFRRVSADVDETTRTGESPADYLVRVILAKFAAVVTRPEALGTGAVLVADTTVLVEGLILGKPRDQAEACTMLRLLSGREHEVWTRFAIGEASKVMPIEAETVVTQVRFRRLADEEVEGYAATGEGLDKAGAYAIQGIGAFAVDRIEGSYSNVMGLPACELIDALRRTGLLQRFPLTSSCVE